MLEPNQIEQLKFLFFLFGNHNINFFMGSSSSSSSTTGLYFICPSLIFVILLLYSINHQFHYFTIPSFAIISTSNHTIQNSEPYFFNGTTTNHTNMKEKEKSKYDKMEEGLARARAAIREAARTKSYESNKNQIFIPRGSAYLNSYAFHQSHIEMEKRFKVWRYREGKPPLFHDGPLNDIYSVEGQFIDEFDSGKSPFLASNPDGALAFFLPVSIVNIVRYVYRPYTTYSRDRLQKIVMDYIALISTKYPYWNRTNGADHFLISCHDWAPDVSAAHPGLYKNFIRVLCNADSSQGFLSTRDVSLPEIYLPFGKLSQPQLSLPPNNRTILAFFAGGDHGDARKKLFEHWKDKDREIQVHGYLPKNLNYTQVMSQTRYCLCPGGYEVASPRVVESIYSGCVPVIISDSYVLPFSDVLNWSRFSVHIPLSEIPRIKEILKGISTEEYLEMHQKVIQVQRHFVVNRPAKPFDVMYMTMHSVWIRRLNYAVFK